ncbi:MAG: membrane protein insertase YidC, partial [Alphaproteobacteria bacterium]|nr:membrane protein insertase YidC [Alphaproteobacteria bacterium]
MNKQPPDTANLIAAMMLCVLVMIGWDYFFLSPQREAARLAKIEQQQATPAAATPGTPTSPGAPAALSAIPAGTPQPREAVLAASAARPQFDNGKIDGSIK